MDRTLILIFAIFQTIRYTSGAVELGVQGAQLRTHLFTIWQLIPAFNRKKNFENPSKIDRVRGKNVNCAPTFKELPPPLGIKRGIQIF